MSKVVNALGADVAKQQIPQQGRRLDILVDSEPMQAAGPLDGHLSALSGTGYLDLVTAEPS
jgi:molybdopterin-guanine dinucleotide biosynthesis protein A